LNPLPYTFKGQMLTVYVDVWCIQNVLDVLCGVLSL